mmetsp:Transcript_29779/g.58071  ORF Transcript_29779/g.58071 Transcript_29779/m.58071 type:complete len:272 (+) Transcript_29779:2718-3533(+)
MMLPLPKCPDEPPPAAPARGEPKGGALVSPFPSFASFPSFPSFPSERSPAFRAWRVKREMPTTCSNIVGLDRIRVCVGSPSATLDWFLLSAWMMISRLTSSLTHVVTTPFPGTYSSFSTLYRSTSFLSRPVAGSMRKALILESSRGEQGNVRHVPPHRLRYVCSAGVIGMLSLLPLPWAGPYRASMITRRRVPTLAMSTSRDLSLAMATVMTLLSASSFGPFAALPSMERWPTLKSFWTRSAVASSSMRAWSVCEWMVRFTSRLPITASIS